MLSIYEGSYSKEAAERAQRFVDLVNTRDAGPIPIPLDDPAACLTIVERAWPEVLGLGGRQLDAALAGQEAEPPEWDQAVLLAQMQASMGR